MPTKTLNYVIVSQLDLRLWDVDGQGAKTIKKNTNSTQNKHAKQYKVTSFLSTDCELSTETCLKNVYSLGPMLFWAEFGFVCKATIGNIFACSDYADDIVCWEERVIVGAFVGELATFL